MIIWGLIRLSGNFFELRMIYCDLEGLKEGYQGIFMDKGGFEAYRLL